MQTAIEELMTLSLKAYRDSSVLQPYLQMRMNYDIDMKLNHLCELEKAMYDINCTEIVSFEEHFEVVYERSELESERNKLQLKLSDEGLSLYPEYTNAVALLKDLGYIDNDERGLSSFKLSTRISYV